MPQLEDNLITMKNAGLFRNGKWLVRSVDLSVMRGEIVTMIGPNGSGKSTTAKMALGVEIPTEGSSKRIGNLRIGYVPQKFNVDWTLPLTVGRLMNLTERISSSEVASILQKMEIAHLINVPVQQLSGGEFQRALLARAIARNPDLLVLDEPVQGLDFASENALYKHLADIRKNLNCGILLISHNLHLVMASTDKVICLNGHVCCQGAPKTVTSNPEYIKLFGKSSDSLAIYTHEHDHTHGSDGRIISTADPESADEDSKKTDAR